MFNITPLEITVNGRKLQIGEPVQLVKSFEIIHMQVGLRVHPDEIIQITNWIYDLVQRCEDEFITYNNVIISKSEVKRYNI